MMSRQVMWTEQQPGSHWARPAPRLWLQLAPASRTADPPCLQIRARGRVATRVPCAEVATGTPGIRVEERRGRAEL